MSDRRNSAPKPPAGYQKQAASNTTTYVLVGVAVAVILGLVIGGFIWNSHRDKGGGVSESVLDQNAALIVGAPGAQRTIDVFEDFKCPVCKGFEQQSGPAISRAVGDGKLRVRYHMLNFLNKQSPSGDYSSRAAGALQCVGAGEDRDVFAKFHTRLFDDQPPENSKSDHSNADLARIAASQGAGPATQQCISSGAKVGEAEHAAEESSTQLSKAIEGPVATPMVLTGGEPVDNITAGPAWLDKLLTKPSA